MKARWAAFGVVAAGLILGGCGGGDDDGPAPQGPVAPGNTGAMVGTVRDVNGQLLGGVNVAPIGHAAVVNNEQGWFSVANLAATDRLAVNFTKPGYVPTAQILRVRAGQSTHVEAVMRAVGQTATVSASAGGSIQHAGGQVTFPPNSFVDSSGNVYSGPVTVNLTTMDPTDSAQREAFPGDFIGVDSTGAEIPIYSYGFWDINAFDASGNRLNLASQTPATVRMPIPASLLSTAPDTIPLWHFDDTVGRWIQSGSSTRQGNEYVGSIPHLSVWNNDVGGNRSYVRGRVVDGSGNPVKGARVTIVGISPRNCWDSGETSTPDDGSFLIPVDANAVCEIWASKGGVSSATNRFNSASTEQTLEYGDIVLGTDVPKVTITLTWGASPRDLDSHLLIPGTPTPAHLFYGTPGKNVAGARLNTDDTDGNGPEITTIYALRDGTYKFGVRQYSSDGNITSSGAQVTIIAEGQSLQYLTPPTGHPGSGGPDWELWEIQVAGGRVTSIVTLNRYVTRGQSGF